MRQRTKKIAFPGILTFLMLYSCSEEYWNKLDFAEEFPREYMRGTSLSLNGNWEVLIDNGEAGLSEPESILRLNAWRGVRVPGNLLQGMARDEQLAVHFAWVRRNFNLSSTQAQMNQLLKWGMIRHGAAVWLNGTFVGEHSAIGPAEFFVPEGVLFEGPNSILLRVPGWSGVAKNKLGKPLIPTGSGPEPWGNKMAQIHDDIWIDFYEGVCLNWILAKPDLAGRSVTFRIWPGGPDLDREFEVSVAVRKWQRYKEEGSATVSTTAAKPFEVSVPIDDVRVWAPDSPWLYTAEFSAWSGEELLDRVAIRFGMRELKIIDGRYVLNGKKTRFFGSNLVNEWDWDLFEGRDDIVRYLYDEARAMNLNCFRTHTCPPPARFANVADEVGTMLFAEFPLLYNYKDFQFSASDYETWHQNGILDATGWVTKLWNHPSIVMWVLTNESKMDVEWESDVFRNHVFSLDPTRPAWRSGGEKGLDEIEDYHICENMSWYAEGRLLTRAEEIAAQRDLVKPLGCSEYMNFLDPRPTTFRRLLGDSQHPYARYMQAENCMEHTDVLRSLRFDLILPYMYAGWTGFRNEKRGNARWCLDWPTPMSAALYSSFSPVYTGFDLADRHFLAGSRIEVRLIHMNDQNQDTTAQVDLYITPVNPLFTVNNLAITAAISHRALGSVHFEADKVIRRTLSVSLPKTEGIYYLYLVTRVEGRTPAVSQRMLHLADYRVSERFLGKERRILVLGGDESAFRWLGSIGADFDCEIQNEVEADQVVVWDIAGYSALTSADRVAVNRFVKNGGQMLLLAVDSKQWQSMREGQLEWLLPDLIDINLKWDNSSRAHAYQGISHPVFTNMIPEGFWRFNGVPNKSSDFYLDPDSLPKSARKILWMENPDMPVLVEIPVGRGQVLICMLYLKSRLDRSMPQYDPFAERIMLNLLFGENPAVMQATEYCLGGTRPN